MKRTRVSLLVVAALASLLAGCGSTDSDGNVGRGAVAQATVSPLADNPNQAGKTENDPVSPSVKPKATGLAPNKGTALRPGNWTVGEDFPAGTYKARNATEFCGMVAQKANGEYGDSASGAGRPKITVNKGETVTISPECGVLDKVAH